MKFTKNENIEFWNNLDTNSENYSGDNNLVKLEDDFLFSNVKRFNQGNLLDVGCGKGQRSLEFSKIMEGNTLGIDYSDNMIEEARKLENNSLHFLKGDVLNFDFQTKKFDIITSCRMLINTPTDQGQLDIVEKLHSLLKPNGILILIERSIQGLDSLNKIRKEVRLNPIPERFHNHYINEKHLLSNLSWLFGLLDQSRLGMFYLISRVIYPAMIYPKEPEQDHILNKIAITLQRNSDSKMDDYGMHLMMVLRKI